MLSQLIVDCMKMISLFTSTCQAMQPIPYDVLTAINSLRISNAFLCCARMQTYAEPKKITLSELSESSLSSLLKLDTLESLEKEYRDSTSFPITTAIKQVIQELPTNKQPSQEIPTSTKPREVRMEMQDHV